MHLPDTTVELVAPNGELRSTHALPLVDGANIDQLLDRLREASGSQSDLAALEDLEITVGTISTYDVTHPGGLVIARDQTLVDYFKQYRCVHGLQPVKRISTCTLEHEIVRCASGTPMPETTIAAGPARIRLFRTLRVPDNGREYPLPPGLGTFPLVPVRGYASQLPESIASRGGLLMPMYQSEALWMSFVGSAACAIKVHAGGINAISGRRAADGPVDEEDQDYVSVPRQPWLDGFCTSEGSVRQFVAAPLGEGYTVAEQLGACDGGSIQLDVYPCLSSAVSCVDTRGRFLDLADSPGDAGVAYSDTIVVRTALPRAKTLAEYKRRVGSTIKVVVNDIMDISVDLLIKHSLSAWEMTIRARPTDTIADLKARICEQRLVPPASQRLVLDGATLEDSASLFQCQIVEGTMLRLDMNIRRSSSANQRVGLAAGGIIAQKVYEDTRDPALYDEHDVERVFIHTVSSRAWECITGTVLPSDAFESKHYTKHHLPWFRIYDESAPAVSPNGSFDVLRSLQFLSSASASANAAAQACASHDTVATRVARPCNHHFCAECYPLIGCICPHPSCGLAVALLVDLTPRGASTASQDGDKDAENMPHDVHDHSVTTLLLAEDGLPPFVACRS